MTCNVTLPLKTEKVNSERKRGRACMFVSVAVGVVIWVTVNT